MEFPLTGDVRTFMMPPAMFHGIEKVHKGSKLIRVGHSPDADDAFMFYAIARKKIPMREFRVRHVIEDIESLNQRALRGELEVTAISCHAYAYAAEKYLVMRSGASVGDNYGPILVAKCEKEKARGIKQGAGRGKKKKTESMTANVMISENRICPSEIRGKRIGVPGKLTTAYLVLRLFEKNFVPVFLPFDRIPAAVSSGDVDLGLLIHEGQITYRELGLEKILDLGTWWHQKTKLPIPLGVDVIRRDLGPETIASFSKLFKSSIEFALAHRKEALRYAISFGRGISEDLNDRFVGMYVNRRTVDIGRKGEAGFRKLMEEGRRAGILPEKISPEFTAV